MLVIVHWQAAPNIPMKIYISTRSDTELANDDQSLGEQFRFANSSGRVTIVDTPPMPT